MCIIDLLVFLGGVLLGHLLFRVTKFGRHKPPKDPCGFPSARDDSVENLSYVLKNRKRKMTLNLDELEKKSQIWPWERGFVSDLSEALPELLKRARDWEKHHKMSCAWKKSKTQECNCHGRCPED